MPFRLMKGFVGRRNALLVDSGSHLYRELCYMHTHAISTNSLVLYEGDEETGEPFLGTYQGCIASIGQHLISSQEQVTP